MLALGHVIDILIVGLEVLPHAADRQDPLVQLDLHGFPIHAG